MYKLFILGLLFLITTNNALALEYGGVQTVTSTEESTEESNFEVFTKTPKHLEGGSIILTKSDGAKEVLKTEDYMIVKRKHMRPIIKKIVKEIHDCPKKPNNHKNIISLKIVDGYGDVRKEETHNSVSLKIRRQVGIGVQYQRSISENVYLGIGVDSNLGSEASLGYGF